MLKFKTEQNVFGSVASWKFLLAKINMAGWLKFAKFCLNKAQDFLNSVLLKKWDHYFSPILSFWVNPFLFVSSVSCLVYFPSSLIVFDYCHLCLVTSLCPLPLTTLCVFKSWFSFSPVSVALTSLCIEIVVASICFSDGLFTRQNPKLAFCLDCLSPCVWMWVLNSVIYDDKHF